MRESPRESPIVIVGSGIAGLWAALHLKPLPVKVLSGRSVGAESSSAWAQGGIAAALGPGDSPESHAVDTIAAGAGLVDREVARTMTAAAPRQVRALEALGVAFEHAADGSWLLSHEAAHGRARVARVNGDQAGKAIVEALIRAARRAPHIELLEGCYGVGLMTDAVGGCAGVVARDRREGLHDLPARAVLVATGGLGGLYAVTTNPSGNQGHALAWAARLGAVIRDPEFVQFHPTAIDVGRVPAPLATEALRGDGALLVDRDGRRFMPELHADAELAPRDVVARAVHHQIRFGDGAWLDARAAVGDAFPQRFPGVFQACIENGIDPRVQPIPIAPAVHYHMGGVAAGLDGATAVSGLFVAGEAACTGVHGANRLASNSLLEALVMGESAARAISSAADTGARRARRLGDLGSPASPAMLESLRRAMSADAGVERDATGLARLLDTIDALEAEHGPADSLLAARLVARGALAREESRGAHCRKDFPAASPTPAHTVLKLEPGAKRLSAPQLEAVR
ncbi:MAG: L-aspartate oxidase [Wenzhouxiangellaceae bacterium]